MTDKCGVFLINCKFHFFPEIYLRENSKYLKKIGGVTFFSELFLSDLIYFFTSDLNK